MKVKIQHLLCLVFVLCCTVAFSQSKKVKAIVPEAPSVDLNSYFKPLVWRNIGPTLVAVLWLLLELRAIHWFITWEQPVVEYGKQRMLAKLGRIFQTGFSKLDL
jgi:hypothetical protein